eukprot:maker-scaffold256_size235750-snap-gene-1.25 protein:Tk08129 transcript:maker-scaffold256_size235750-snap-gene-1.25-mRNA-1 annotation:"glycosyltransferase family 2 protein"
MKPEYHSRRPSLIGSCLGLCGLKLGTCAIGVISLLEEFAWIVTLSIEIIESLSQTEQIDPWSWMGLVVFAAPVVTLANILLVLPSMKGPVLDPGGTPLQTMQSGCSLCSFRLVARVLIVLELVALAAFIAFNIYQMSVTVETKTQQDFCIVQIVISAVFFLCCLFVIGGIQIRNEHLFTPYIFLSVLGLILFFIFAPIYGIVTYAESSGLAVPILYLVLTVVSALQIFYLWVISCLYGIYRKAKKPRIDRSRLGNF